MSINLSLPVLLPYLHLVKKNRYLPNFVLYYTAVLRYRTVPLFINLVYPSIGTEGILNVSAAIHLHSNRYIMHQMQNIKVGVSNIWLVG